MTHYIALIHKDADSCYGVSFPDVPGVIAAADTLDAAIIEAAEALAFAAEGWAEDTGTPFPPPRDLDDLRTDPEFRESAADAVVAAIPFGAKAEAAA
jgi:antitoxin HicB